MFKKLVCNCLILGAVTILGISSAHAARSLVNPMSPRITSIEKCNQEYTYGFSKLPGNAIDSLEGLNRAFFFVNYDIFDKYLLRPIAHGYAKLPKFIQTGTGNFFANIRDFNNFINNLILGEFTHSGVSLGRFTLNTIVGLGGLFDVATDMGINRYEMKMRTVLGKYGMDSGAYLMVPLYGGTTSRDLQGNLVDATPLYFFPWYVGTIAYVLDGIQTRAQFIDQEGLIDNAIDPYIQYRDVYLMYEQGKVNDGNEELLLQDDFEELDPELLDEIDSL